MPSARRNARGPEESEHRFGDDAQRLAVTALSSMEPTSCVLPAAFQACRRSLMRSGAATSETSSTRRSGQPAIASFVGRQEGVLDLHSSFLVTSCLVKSL